METMIPEREMKKKVNTQLLGMTEEEIPRISLKGAEVVRRQYLSHIKEAIVTIRPDGIQFNNSCIAKMEDVYYILMLIQRKQKRLIIKACEQGDMESQRWCAVKNGERKSRKITGRDYCSRIYDVMGWNKGFNYKVCGTPALQVDVEDELLMVFDLEEAERYLLSAKARKDFGVTEKDLGEELENVRRADAEQEAENQAAKKEGRTAKRIRRKGEFPKHWDTKSFGTPIENYQKRVVLPRVEDIKAEDGQMSLSDYEGFNES